MGDKGLEPLTPSLSSSSANVSCAQNKALSARGAKRCTKRCTKTDDRRDELARMVALVARLPGTDDDRAAVLARLVEQADDGTGGR